MFSSNDLTICGKIDQESGPRNEICKTDMYGSFTIEDESQPLMRMKSDRMKMYN